MSTTIDEKVVEMRFDNKDFEKNVSQTMDTIGSLKKSLNFEDSVKGFSNLEKASKGVKFGGLSDAIDTVKVKMSALGVIGMTALANITNSAVNAGKQLVKSLTIAPIKQGFDEYELKMNSVQTIMASTGESIETVNKYLEELNTYADRTIYSFSDMTASIGKFTNAGVSLDDAVKAIKGISNEAAVSGANANEASRAMYNFAQALSSGAVKLIDWKSIENANMATIEFKQTLIDTAEAMGTVVKVDGKYKSITTDNNGNVSEAFTATSKFNDSLSSQWMTTEVLVQALQAYSTDIRDMTAEEKKAYEEKLKTIGYTEEQIKQIEKLGQKAYDAAQDVKTFTQLIDTLKEAAGSGWARTFELIFGDLEGAKKLWTAVSKEIGGLIDKSADERNALIESWAKMGGSDALFEGIANIWKNIRNVLGAAKSGIKDIFPDLKATQLFKLTSQFRDFTKAIMANEEELDKVRRIFKGLAAVLDIGRQLISAVWNQVKNIFKYFGMMSGGLLEGAATLGDYLVKLRDWIEDNQIFVKAIDLAIKAVGGLAKGIDNLVKTISGHGVIDLFGMLGDKLKKFYDILKLIFQALGTKNLNGELETFNERFKELTGLNFDDSKLFHFFSKIHDIFSGLKNLVSDLVKGESFADALKKFFGDAFSLDISKFIQFFDGFGESVKNAWGKVSSAFKGMTGGFDSFKDTMSKAWEKISESFTKAKEAISTAWDKIKEVLSEATGVDLTGVVKFANIVEILLKPLQIIFTVIQKVFEGLSWAIINFGPTIISVLKSLGEVFVSFVHNIAEAIGNADFNKVIDFFTSGAVAVIFTKLAQMLLGLKSAGKALKEMGDEDGKFSIIKMFKTLGESGKEIAEKVGALFGSVKDVLKAWQQDLQANVLIKIAAAIGILAVSLALLSGIDQEKLVSSLGAVTAMFAELIATFKLLSASMTTTTKLGEMKDNVVNFTQLMTSVLAISGAMLLMSIALKNIASIEPKRMVIAIAGIGALFAEIIAVFKILSKDEKLLIQMPKGMVAMATALYIMAMSVKKLGKMDPLEMLQGIGGLGAILVEILSFIQLLKKSSKKGDNPEEASQSLAAIAGGLIVLAVALRMMVTSVKSMGKMDPDKLIQGLFGMFTVLTMVVGFIKFFEAPNTDKGQAGIMRIASMMLVIANAMILMASAMKIMGSMDFEQIGNAALGFFGIFATIILTIKNLQDETHILRIAGAMNLFAIALTILATAMKIVASIPVEGLLKAAVGIDFVLGSLMLFSAFTEGDNLLKVSAAMLVFSAALLVLTPALKLLSTIDAKGMLVIGGTIASVFAILLVAAKASKGLVVHMLALAGAMALLGIGVLALGTGLVSLAAGLTAISASAPAVMEFLILFVATFLAGIPKIIFATLKAILDAILYFGKDVLIAILKVINEVTPVLIETLFNLLDKLMESLAKHLPKIVKDLSDLIVNLLNLLGRELPRIVDALLNFALDLVDGLGEAINKNARKFVEVIGDLVVNLLSAALNMVFPWLIDWITGGTNEVIEVVNTLSEEEKQLIERVSAMAESYQKVYDARNESMGNIDNEYQRINDLKEEYNHLVDSNGHIITGFEERARVIKTTLAEAMGISVDQVENLIDANGRLSGSFDAVISKMKAEAYLEANKEFYQEALTNTTKARKNYYDSLNAETTKREELTNIEADLVGAQNKLKEALENGESMNVVNTWIKQVSYLDKKKKEITNSLGELSSTRRTAERNLVGYEAELRNYDELNYAITTGNVDLIEAAIERLNTDYISSAEGTSMTLKQQIRDGEAELKRLLELRKTNPELVSKEDVEKAESNLGKYRGELVKLELGYTKVGTVSSSTMSQMSTDIQNGSETVKTSAKEAENGVVESFGEMPIDIANIDAKTMEQLGGDMDLFKIITEHGGEDAGLAYVQGLMGSEDDVEKETETIAKKTKEPFEELPGEMENIGINSILGLLNGLKKTAPKVEAESAAVAAHHVAIVKERLDENSPSRVMEEIGEYSILGLILGIRNLKDEVGAASNEVANESINTMSSILSNVGEILDSGMDIDPTIRPVMDLSDISAGVSAMNSMLDTTDTVNMALRASRDVNSAFSVKANSPLNVNNTDIVNTLKGLREDVNNLNSRVGSLQVIMDTGTLVGAIADPLNSTLGKKAVYRGRGI